MCCLFVRAAVYRYGRVCVCVRAFFASVYMCAVCMFMCGLAPDPVTHPLWPLVSCEIQFQAWLAFCAQTSTCAKYVHGETGQQLKWRTQGCQRQTGRQKWCIHQFELPHEWPHLWPLPLCHHVWRLGHFQQALANWVRLRRTEHYAWN